MWHALQKRWKRHQLRNEAYAFLFEEGSSDEVVIFDCETTGLNPKVDDLVALAAVKVRGNKILSNEALHLYIKQSRALTPKSVAIHQIRHCDLEDAVDSDEAIERFLHFIGGRKLVGYYLEFDMAMVNKYIQPMIGTTLPNRTEEVSACYYDQKIGRIPQGNVDLRFESIMNDLDLPKLPSHDALNDAIMTAMMYVKLHAKTSVKQ